MEAAELALAIASLLAERAAWHEQHLDLAGADAIRRARRGVLGLAPGTTLLLHEEVRTKAWALRRVERAVDRVEPQRGRS